MIITFIIIVWNYFILVNILCQLLLFGNLLINKKIKITISSEYTISREEEVLIKPKYKHHQIVEVYTSHREEFVCSLMLLYKCIRINYLKMLIII